MVSKTKTRTGLIAALDVGTTKVACFIAHADDDGSLRVLGVGNHRSRGMRSGQVANMEELEGSIRAAVDAAELMANQRIQKVLVNVSGGHPRSHKVGVDLAVAGQDIRDRDVRRILEAGRAQHSDADRELVHCIPVGYTIDGTPGIVDPRGMYGDRLGVDIHLVSAAAGAIRNLSTVVERSHLEIEALVVSPYASGLACAVEDEKEMGVTVIDMGGGTTTISVFQDGHIVHVDSVAVGGNHVTNDIAKGLSTPVANAERLKTVYGSVIATPADDRDLLKVPLVGEEDDTTPNEVPRSMLVHIVRPRVEETLELVRQHLDQAGLLKAAGPRCVITGGASQLAGLRDLAETILEKQVRLGRPLRIKGLPESVSGPAFSTVAGLVRYAAYDHVETPQQADPEEQRGPQKGKPRGKGKSKTKGRSGSGVGAGFARISQWLRENF